MVALVDGVPRTLNLRDALVAYVDHQVEVIRRRSEFRLAKAQARAHIVEGLLKAIDMIDAIIALIRASADRGEARTGLMAEPFEFSEKQAVHILDMQLGRLTRLGRTELEAEMAELRETIAELEAILGSRERLMAVIAEELTAVRDEFADDRVSIITYDVGDLDIEDLIDDEELVVTLSHRGYVKTVAAGAFRTQGRGGRGVAGVKLKDEDFVTQVITTTAHAYLLFFSNRGKVYRLKAHEIPMKDRTARGTAMVNLLPLMNDEHIQAIIDTRDYETSRFLFFATKHGQVKKTKFTEYDSSRRDGLIAIKLKDDDELVRVIQTTGDDDIFIVSANGQTIRFNEDLVRPMGRSTGGVRGLKLKPGDEVVSCASGREGVDLLLITEFGYGKRTKLDKFPTKGRGTMGVKGFKLTAKKGRVTQARMVGIDDEIILISSGGTLIRVPVKEISSQGRDAGGVRVMNLGRRRVGRGGRAGLPGGRGRHRGLRPFDHGRPDRPASAHRRASPPTARSRRSRRGSFQRRRWPVGRSMSSSRVGRRRAHPPTTRPRRAGTRVPAAPEPAGLAVPAEAVGPSSATGGRWHPFAVLLLLLAGSAVLILTPIGRATIDRAEARTAADAAALAGAADGPDAARRPGRGQWRPCDRPGGGRDRFDRHRAGRCTPSPPPAPSGYGHPTGEPRSTGLAPAMLAAIARAEHLLGQPDHDHVRVSQPGRTAAPVGRPRHQSVPGGTTGNVASRVRLRHRRAEHAGRRTAPGRTGGRVVLSDPGIGPHTLRVVPVESELSDRAPSTEADDGDPTATAPSTLLGHRRQRWAARPTRAATAGPGPPGPPGPASDRSLVGAEDLLHLLRVPVRRHHRELAARLAGGGIVRHRRQRRGLRRRTGLQRLPVRARADVPGPAVRRGRDDRRRHVHGRV